MFKNPVCIIDVGYTAKLLNSEYKMKRSYKKKSPMKSAIIRFAVCFDPNYITTNQDNAVNKFGSILEKVLNLKRLPSAKFVDGTKEQYQSFIKLVVMLIV